MSVDVTTFIQILNMYDDQKQRKTTRESVSSTPITRDLLGGCSTLGSQELDLDLQVPSGWEKRLDLKSGKVYIQRCNSSPYSSSSESKTKTKTNSDDKNFPPQSKKLLNLLDDTSLKLRLSPTSSSSSSSLSCYQSVCTLDKVKCALERAKNETHNKKRSKSSSSHSNSSSSILDMEEEEVEKKPISSSFAAGCQSCLLYVLISKNNSQCPRCHTTIPLPQTDKRPRIDLNMSIEYDEKRPDLMDFCK